MLRVLGGIKISLLLKEGEGGILFIYKEKMM